MATKTLVTLRTDVRSHVDETTAARWSDAELNRWLNEGCLDIARRAEILQTKTAIVTTPGVQGYALPANFLRAHRAEWVATGGTYVYALQLRDYNAMDEVWGAYPAAPGSSPYVMAIYGYPQLAYIYPVPSSAGILTVFHYRLPTPEMTADGHLPDLPSGWDDLLVDYAVHRALIKDGNPTWQEARKRYEASLAELMDHTRRWHDQAGMIVGPSGNGLPSWLVNGWGRYY